MHLLNLQNQEEVIFLMAFFVRTVNQQQQQKSGNVKNDVQRRIVPFFIVN